MKRKLIPMALSVIAAVSLLLSTLPVVLADNANPTWDAVYPEACDPTKDKGNGPARQEVVKLVKAESKGEAGSEVTLVSGDFASAHSSFESDNAYGWSSYSFDLTIKDLNNSPTALLLAMSYNKMLTIGTNRSLRQLDRALGLKIDLQSGKMNVYRMRAHKGTNLAVEGGYHQFNFWDEASEAEAAAAYDKTEFDFDVKKTHHFVIYKQSETLTSSNKKQFNYVFLMDGIVIHKVTVNELGFNPDPNEDDFFNLRNASPMHIVMGLNSQALSATPDDAITAKVLVNFTTKKTSQALAEAVAENEQYIDTVTAAENPVLGQTTTAAKQEFAAAIQAAKALSEGEDQSEETLYPALAALKTAREKFEKSIVRPLDKEALQEAITYAESTMEALGNTATGYAELAKLVADAKALLNNQNATAAEGEEMVSALIEAADALELPDDGGDDDGSGEDDGGYDDGYDDGYEDGDNSGYDYGNDSEINDGDFPKTGDDSAPVSVVLSVFALALASVILIGKKCIG